MRLRRGEGALTPLDDPEVVRVEYASEDGLLGRAAAYRHAEGPDAKNVALTAVAEAAPRRVLEVGCGTGELAERVVRELDAQVVAIDQSARMVELTRRRGIDAEVGDVQTLRFADGEFDCAIAAWMLYHVPDVPRAIDELARVLRPGGRLVAVTNGVGHLRELRQLLGVEPLASTFSRENGERLLRLSFSAVETRDAGGWINFPDRAAVQSYVDASRVLWSLGELPQFETPLRVRRAPVVFVATR